MSETCRVHLQKVRSIFWENLQGALLALGFPFGNEGASGNGPAGLLMFQIRPLDMFKCFLEIVLDLRNHMSLISFYGLQCSYKVVNFRDPR